MFVDLFNLSNYLIPRDRIPPLSSSMKMRLRTALVDGRLHDSDSALCSDSSEDDQESAVTSKIKDVAITTAATADTNWSRKTLLMASFPVGKDPGNEVAISINAYG